jgi:hypothetical protein
MDVTIYILREAYINTRNILLPSQASLPDRRLAERDSAKHSIESSGLVLFFIFIGMPGVKGRFFGLVPRRNS